MAVGAGRGWPTTRRCRALDRFAIHGTNVLVALIALGFATVLVILALAAPGLSGINYVINAVVVIAITVITLLFASNMLRSGRSIAITGLDLHGLRGHIDSEWPGHFPGDRSLAGPALPRAQHSRRCARRPARTVGSG